MSALQSRERGPGVPRRRDRASHAGFSLVELMVSLAISLVILAALVGMFVNTSTNSREMERANSVIENGRLAIQVVQNDVVHAGFWGSFVPQFDDLALSGPPSDAPTAVPDACLAYSATNWPTGVKSNLIGMPVDASTDATICSAIVTDKQANTDVLVVRHVETCNPDVAGGCPANTPGVTGKLYFQSSRCSSDTLPYVLDTNPVAFVLHQRDCTTIAEKRAYVSNVYYVRTYAVTPGDGIPTLVRSQFDLTASTGVAEQQPPVALIEGVEGFTVELGIDDRSKPYTDSSGVAHPDGDPVNYTQAVSWLDPDTRTTPINRGDGAPDGAFVHCAPSCTVGELENVTAVKLYVLSRSRDLSRGYTDTKTYALGGGTTLGPFNDSYKRHLFVTTIRLPNVAGRRETPP